LDKVLTAVLCSLFSFGRELSTDHLCDEVMLITQKLHHRRGGGDRIIPRLGGIAPLAWHCEPGQAECEQSGEQTRGLCHCPTPLINVSNDRLKFKHLFEKKARHINGNYVTFFGHAALGLQEGVGPERRPRSLASSRFAAALRQ
jgi:hypothetical protein